MTDNAQQQELNQLKSEVDAVMESIHQFDEQIEERNTKRLMLIESLKELLPQEQFERFEEIINKTIEAVKPAPEPSTLPPLQIDEENPLESLRKIRCHIAREVCTVMGVESPQL